MPVNNLLRRFGSTTRSAHVTRQRRVALHIITLRDIVPTVSVNHNVVNSDDELQIRQLVTSFALAAIQRDYPRFAETWAADGVWRIAEPIGVEFVSRAAIAEAIPIMLARWAWFIQIPHNGVISVDGDRGTGEWLMTERARPAVGDGGHFNHGIYRDRYVREQGAWKFAERTYHYLYIDSSTPSGEGGLNQLE